MTIDQETVDKIAHLARLELSGDEKQEMIKDMSKILDFMAKLNEIDTSGIEPLVYMTNEVNVLREDIVKQQVTHQEALQNAPKHDDDYFLVAKVIDLKSESQ
ncbi:Asp-tRNA(Asn)/Glu-tRNA(Gln) amidotransferase subunit GatC [Mucilaginibacter sp. OK098]|jgi:aspartyl-tRNA(Asn)/glutamyl-tRNA(Gln) amidotransferase subunit C|uniref:Asp-tRNA(Asn)/Glu-tRNA(Gln) amidotransferase subunit GatC n=1 Tax=Mucilaginibacter sp. OK098 TaxID=1855297 RepID=UPI000913F461|nr:Asp-tRNA(Asn)/Glu-tRNA(Gln) amidotransferase subunit GatC [Mucilaginibacter sp. OK098]MDB5087358.1 aspartyl/glutamyl-tRNA(Asn/Gln) amidotransferase subunit [Mucilaginibacter sp.]SHN28816.1 aspartyl/glutamyl-tRNA(Asn/Gln) amidotransferase subunit C [Mucilaginibacter sp. OK098]